MRFGILVLLAAFSVEAEDCPPERYGILEGRSFHRMGCDNSPHLSLILRISSEDYPRAPDLERGSNLEFIYQPLRRVDLTQVTLAQVSEAMRREDIEDDPVPALFMLKYLSASDRDQVIRRDGKSLTMAEKVAAAQYLGYLASQRYDWSKRLSVNRPVHSSTQVANAAFAELTGDNSSLLAGDCADLANAQGVLLEKLGAKDVMAVTGSTLDGLHTTVVARDPAGQSYYQLNYEVASHSSYREGADLLQPPGDSFWADIGPSLYLNKPGGATVAHVPTNSGKLYTEVAGLDIHEIEPMARANSSLAGAQIQFPWRGSMQVFAARDSIGSWYGGIAFTQNWATHGYFPGAIGTVIATRNTVQDVTVGDYYLQIEQHALTPQFRLARWLGLRFDSTLIILGSYSLPWHDITDSTWGFGAAIFLDAGAQLVAGGQRASGRLRVDVQLVPGLENIAGSTPTVFVNHVSLVLDGRARIGRHLDLTGGSSVIVDYFGARLWFAAGLEHGRVGVHLEALGRASESTATYKDGSLRRARLVGGLALDRRLRFTLAGEVREGPGWSVIGALGSLF